MVKGLCLPQEESQNASETSEDALARLPAWIRILRELERLARAKSTPPSGSSGEGSDAETAPRDDDT